MNRSEILEVMRKKIKGIRFLISKKLWFGETAGQTFIKRFKLFVIICASLVVISKLLFFSGFTIPNLELIIPVLVVVGAFTVHTGHEEKWSKLNKYFGIITLSGVFLTDMVIWGPRPIYMFTWPSFLAVWLFSNGKDLSFMDDYSETVSDASFLTAFSILFYDAVTAFGVWILWNPLSLGSLIGVYIAQIPFTIYHLSSLLFVPPLVYIGKKMTKVRVRAVVRVKEASSQRVRL